MTMPNVILPLLDIRDRIAMATDLTEFLARAYPDKAPQFVLGRLVPDVVDQYPYFGVMLASQSHQAGDRFDSLTVLVSSYLMHPDELGLDDLTGIVRPVNNLLQINRYISDTLSTGNYWVGGCRYMILDARESVADFTIESPMYGMQSSYTIYVFHEE